MRLYLVKVVRQLTLIQYFNLTFTGAAFEHEFRGLRQELAGIEH